MPWLTAVKLLLMILSELPGLITTAQRAFSGVPGQSGVAKKELVMQTASIALDGAAAMGADGAAEHKDMILGAVSKATDGAVGIMNAVGALSHNNPNADAGGPLEK